MSANIDSAKEKILLLSDLHNISEFYDIINAGNQKIISFDYKTHTILENHNISHTLSENFLNESDFSNIDNNSIKFSKWYEEKFLTDVIFFENINLGELLRGNFQHFLILFLKKYVEIKNIFSLNPNAFFLVSAPLFKILKLFTNNISIIKNSIDDNVSSNDTNLKLFNSKTKYLALENKKFFQSFIFILENFFKKFTNSNVDENYKTILMINFTTKRNKPFLLTLSKFKMNFIKFDRHFPSIWNFDSFSTIKNSNSIIENYFSLINNDTQKFVLENVNLINKNMKKTFDDEQFFNFFNLNELSFWPAIKHDLEKLFFINSFFLVSEIILIKNLFKKYSFSHILVLNESGIQEKIAIYFAKKMGVKISCLQHGLLYPIQKNLDNFLGGFPVLSDYFCSWGPMTHEYFKNIQTSSTSVIETGSPFYDDVEISGNSSSDYILVAPAGFQNYSSTHKTISARLEYEKSLEQICKIATKLNKKLIIKIHPGLLLNEERIAKKINPDIQVIKSGYLLELIKSCSILITLGPTSATIESLILNKPTFCVPINAPNCNVLFENHEDLVIPLSKLDQTIELFFTDKNFSKKLLDLGNRFLKNYMINHKKSSSFLLKFLEKN